MFLQGEINTETRTEHTTSMSYCVEHDSVLSESFCVLLWLALGLLALLLLLLLFGEIEASGLVLTGGET
jgi:hypothetical protein